MLSPLRRDDQCRLIRVWMESKVSYRTVLVTAHTTTRDVVSRLARPAKCADPQLYQLHMQVSLAAGVPPQTVRLEDNTRLLELLRCNPWAHTQFILVTEQRLPVRVWDNISQNVVFRSLLVSMDCTVGAALDILHRFYPDQDNGSLALYEHSDLLGYNRRLQQDEMILKISESWSPESQFRFVLEQETSDRMMDDLLDSSDGIEDVSEDFLDSSVQSFYSSHNSSSDASSINSESFLYVPFDFV